MRVRGGSGPWLSAITFHRTLGHWNFTGGTGLRRWGLRPVTGGNGRRPNFRPPGICHYPVPAAKAGGWEPSQRARSSGKHPSSPQRPSLGLWRPSRRFGFHQAPCRHLSSFPGPGGSLSMKSSQWRSSARRWSLAVGSVAWVSRRDLQPS